MKRYRKVLAGILAVGILISGIGAGIGLMEFFSLNYAGERIVGETEMAVKEGEVSFTVPPNGETVPVYLNYGNRYLQLKWDDTVPENTLRYRINYNQKVLEPKIWQNEEAVGVDFVFLDDDEIKNMMEFRDVILKDLSKNTIGSYKRKEIESILLYINPKNRDDITIW